MIDGNIDDIVYSADGKIAVIGGNAYYFNAGSVEIRVLIAALTLSTIRLKSLNQLLKKMEA